MKTAHKIKVKSDHFQNLGLKWPVEKGEKWTVFLHRQFGGYFDKTDSEGHRNFRVFLNSEKLKSGKHGESSQIWFIFLYKFRTSTNFLNIEPE